MSLCTHFVRPSLETSLEASSPAQVRLVPTSDEGVHSRPANPGVDNALARLVALLQSNDRLLADLKVLDGRLADAKVYLATPGANLLLGRSRVERVRDQRSLVMTALRSNRIAAREFLSSPVS